MKGFKDFVMQGNVIDLAVGVVIGSAFTALIGAFVSNLIEPVVNVFGGSNVDGFAFRIIQDNEGTLVNLGAVISAIIAFLITAAVVYFVFVMPIAKARQLARVRRGLPAEEESAAPEDVVLLEEIRDLLRQQNGIAPEAGTTEDPRI
ncbi:MAG: large conductance mechanosensitive channel protein MscL [Brachybacterium sp.]|nr:large conductance mechanosensitive channel protein MscL [Brachybacterium sp.]